MAYLPRIIDVEVERGLRSLGAVLIEGPRGCGKTVTGRKHSASEIRLDADPAIAETARLAPQAILDGPAPRLIDEWQLAPILWNRMRHEIDDRQQPGQFILTGSAQPPDDQTRHTGAGRVMRVRMRPMSLWESGASNGSVSLARVLRHETHAGAVGELDFVELVSVLARGGWPGLRQLSSDDALAAVSSYLQDTARADVVASTGVRRDPGRLTALLRALARHSAQPVSNKTLARDAAGAGDPMAPATVAAYLDALTRIHVIEDQPAWAPGLRSRTRVRASPKRHFIDPSLAVAALGATSDRLLRDPETLGLLFESMVVRDLRVYAQALDARVLHYRDEVGLEADAIIEMRDGTWAAVEVKLSEDRVDDAAASLHRLAARVDAERAGRPAALITITAGRYGYRRDDGVFVVPISALGP